MQKTAAKPAAQPAIKPIPISLRVANALHKLGVHGLPRNYELFYDAIGGTNTELQAEFWALGRRPTQEQLDVLYEKYYGPKDQHKVVEDAREELETSLYEAIDLLKSEQSSISAYGRVLDKTTHAVGNDAMGEGISEEVFLRVVEVLANATGTTLEQGKKILTSISEKSVELESLKTKLDEYKVLANTDPLTSTWNRRSFDEKLPEFGAKGRPGGALLIADIDKFKSINDTYGHPFGDAVIRDTALVIRSKLRSDVFIARTGGEEFAIFLEKTDAKLAMAIADRIVAAVRGVSFSREQIRLAQGQVTISVGVCSTDRADDGSDLYAKADSALYASKNAGRDRATLYENAKSQGKDWYLYRD